MRMSVLHSSGYRYALEYTVPRLCQKYTFSEWAWIYGSGYPLKCIAPLFPIGTQNLHVSLNFFKEIISFSTIYHMTGDTSRFRVLIGNNGAMYFSAYPGVRTAIPTPVIPTPAILVERVS